MILSRWIECFHCTLHERLCSGGPDFDCRMGCHRRIVRYRRQRRPRGGLQARSQLACISGTARTLHEMNFAACAGRMRSARTSTSTSSRVTTGHWYCIYSCSLAYVNGAQLLQFPSMYSTCNCARNSRVRDARHVAVAAR